MKNELKFEIKIDPLDFHVGLKEQMAEFESFLRIENPGKSIAENIEKEMKSRFCHCCFFGHVKGEIMGEPLCAECAKILYGFDENEERPGLKKIDPYYQLWYRRQKALPIFEDYLHSELERYKLEQKLEDTKATVYADSVDAGMENRRLKRELWIARALRAEARKNYWYVRSIHEGDKNLWSIDGSAVKYIGCIKRTNFDWLKIWSEVECKCLAKAEEYDNG